MLRLCPPVTVSVGLFIRYDYFVQEDRERMVVRRYKFEEPRLEQIQDLEVCNCLHPESF